MVSCDTRLATYTLYNIDRVKLEHLLHTFFAESRLNLEITDRFGKKIKPREWFLIPPDVISEAVLRLKDGSIVDYKYDAGRVAIVRKYPRRTRTSRRQCLATVQT